MQSKQSLAILDKRCMLTGVWVSYVGMCVTSWWEGGGNGGVEHVTSPNLQKCCVFWSIIIKFLKKFDNFQKSSITYKKEFENFRKKSSTLPHQYLRLLDTPVCWSDHFMKVVISNDRVT